MMKVMGHFLGTTLINFEAMDETRAGQNVRHSFGFGGKRLNVIRVGIDSGIIQVSTVSLEHKMRKVIDPDGRPACCDAKTC